MSTKIAVIYDKPQKLAMFEAGYRDQLCRPALPVGSRRFESIQ
jgi:hypothetical protein